ncbi:MAG: undecaprenyl-diphosphate phosphatase [Hyphomonadaceae bacterium]
MALARAALRRGVLSTVVIADQSQPPPEFTHVQAAVLHGAPGDAGWDNIVTRLGDLTTMDEQPNQAAAVAAGDKFGLNQTWLLVGGIVALLAVPAALIPMGDELSRLGQAALLGVLQGLTEFLPVSSTAHLLIGGQLIGYDDPGGAFTVMIQLGSILAVMWLYRQRIIDVVIGLPTKPEARRFALMLFLAFLPAVGIGFFAADYVKRVLYESFGVIAWALLIGGVVMLLLERYRPAPVVDDAAKTPIWRAVAVGFMQCVAMIPGVSRSGATIYGGLLLGLDRRAAAEFSFFLAMPTMMAAFIYDFIQIKDDIGADRIAEIAVGFVFAFISAAIVVKPFLDYVTRIGFARFAWYRIGLGAVLLGAMAMGWL